MFGFIVARALMGTVKALEHPLEMLHTATDILAGVKRGEKKVPIKLDLFVTEEIFERIIQHPDVVNGWREAKVLKKAGSLPICPECGGLCAHG